jgi:CelD/BcsL family acetyltransferase involved in cellulose biosynthesis
MLSLRTVIARTPSQMDALAPLWERLLRQQPHSLFQRFSWNRLAAQMFSDRLAPYVVCVQGDTGAAIIPAATSFTGDRFELLGEILFDYRDVVHSGDPEVLRLAWQRLAQREKPLNVVSVDHLTGGERWNDFPLSPFAMAPQVKDIAEDTFRLAHSRLGRQMRRLRKQGVVLRISSGNDSQVVRHLYACKRAHFAGDESDNLFLDSRRCEFMVAAAALEGSSCEIYTLEQGASLVAGLVTFRDADTRRFYTIYFNPAWARYSPGQALLFEATARSLAEGLRCDYMTGEYPYKLRLANASRPLFRVDLSAEQLANIASRIPAASAA